MKKAFDVTLVTHAISAVRAIHEELKGKLDGRTCDVFVRCPDGKIERPSMVASFEQFKAANRTATRQLEDYGARLRDDWRGARITLCGISATCTAGIQGAMANWLRAAEAKNGGAA